jgi:hypothetical protein
MASPPRTSQSARSILPTLQTATVRLYRSSSPAAIAVAERVASELVVLGSVDSVQTHACAVDFNGRRRSGLPVHVVRGGLFRDRCGVNHQREGIAHDCPPARRLVQPNQSELRPHCSAAGLSGERRFPRIGTAPYGAPTATEVTIRANTTTVAVSVVAPTKACATHRFTMVFPSTKTLNAFSMPRLRRVRCVDRSVIHNPSRQGCAAGLFLWLLGSDSRLADSRKMAAAEAAAAESADSAAGKQILNALPTTSCTQGLGKSAPTQPPRGGRRCGVSKAALVRGIG